MSFCFYGDAKPNKGNPRQAPGVYWWTRVWWSMWRNLHGYFWIRRRLKHVVYSVQTDSHIQTTDYMSDKWEKFHLKSYQPVNMEGFLAKRPHVDIGCPTLQSRYSLINWMDCHQKFHLSLEMFQMFMVDFERNEEQTFVWPWRIVMTSVGTWLSPLVPPGIQHLCVLRLKILDGSPWGFANIHVSLPMNCTIVTP